jgi:putative hydrolase of the HAD superfamily
VSALRRAGAPRVRTVFFDLGDTLMHIPDVPSVYLEACRELGLEVDRAGVAAALRVAEGLYREALRSGRSFESSLPEARAFWLGYNQLILAELGATGDTATPARRLSELFWSPPAWRVFPEVHEVLGALRDAGLQLAVISNFTDALTTVCRSHVLDGYFDCLVSSVVSGAQKPDVGIFREALRRTGADPLASVHVGDNYVADVLGARAAGIDAVLVDRSRNGGRRMLGHALRDGLGETRGVVLDCPVIADLRELLDLL